MANLSQNDRNIIAKHPLDTTLDHLRKPLQTTEQSYEPGSLSFDGAADNSNHEPQEAISKILLALMGHKVASDLRSKIGNDNVATELSTLFGLIQRGRYNYEHYRALSRLVVKQAPDVDIWNAVFDLITTVSRTTPPPLPHSSFTSSFQQTPWFFNTGGFEDTSEYRKQVDIPLREELLPSLRLDIPDFVDAVFGCVPQLEKLAETVFGLCQEEDTPLYNKDSGWSKWPSSAEEKAVLEWLQELMERLTVWVYKSGMRATISRQIYRGPDKYLNGTPINRKMDVGFAVKNGQSGADTINTHESIDNWSEILVTGELKSNPNQDGQRQAWVDLATYAREVFRSQDRRFVLGFTLCGSMMRLWHFDRSGASGSSSFDINRNGLAFIRVMLSCLLMTDEQLGLDPTIQGLEGKRFVEITRDGQVERLVLTAKITKPAAIVSRATTCWRAYRDIDKMKKPLIVKDSWQYKERPEEGSLIQEATNGGVENIARYYHHETVRVHGEIDDTLGNIRGELMKKCGRTSFRQKAVKKPGAIASESQEQAAAGQMQPPSLLGKRSSDSAQLDLQSPAKQSRSSFQLQESEKPPYNRVHRRIVTRDAGKAIYEAKSLQGIINGFLGAIHGHESLLSAGILHRDISSGNIIVTENEDDGFLIDLDLAIKISDDRASGAPGKTGTKIFMAIGALLDEPHSYMHDLESFFWVLFWICIHYEGLDEKGEPKRRIVPEYEKWNYADTEELAKSKGGQILRSIFDNVGKNFTEHCKPLVPCMRELHKVVFPDGNPRSNEYRELYSDIKRILEKARNNVDPKNMQ